MAYDMYRKTIDYRENPILLSKSIYVQRILNSFFNICICCAGVDESFVPAGWEVYELFQAWLETDFFKKVRDKFPDIQGNIDQIVDNFVGAAYSGDPTCHAEEVEAIIFEKMKKAIAEERKQTPDICFDYATYLQIMAKRNPDKAKDYYYELARYYDDVISPITDPDFIGGYNTGCLGALMKLRSMADFSPKELEEEASYIKKHMLDYFRLEQAVDDNSSILTGAIPNMLFSQNIISLFKTSQEKTDVIQNMFISRHISTYMHCNMVAVFSQCIAKWALKKKPELFIGLFGISSAEAAISDSESIMAAIHRHAMLHDIGKIGIQEVVSRQYRPITDEEFQIIKLHPDGGANYLKGIPGLEDCADTARGHHRFYNGQGGYPADFDNTKSPVRLIIDIVTLSDCLDAATDYMGRNYRSVKTAAQVVDEFRASAGIRYNPDLVELMSDPDMVEELDNIASKQRKQIFIESCHASAMSLK